MSSKALDLNSDFGIFRKLFWPIHHYELKKFLPMVLMMFFFLFNYTIMRDTKDTLVVTEAGAEVIPFLKFWGTLPLSILFVIVYAKLSNILKTETLFYTMIVPFLLFFSAFGFIIYPNIEAFHPDLTANALQAFVETYLPIQSHDALLKLVKIVRVWPYAIFYSASELWGSMGISLLFWQFANQITRPEEAKRFYGGFAQLGNLALVASGLTIIHFSTLEVPLGVDRWGVSLKWLMSAITFGCIMIMLSYWWMNRYVLTDPKLVTSTKTGKSNQKKAKTKLSLTESFKYLTRSKYLGCIAMLVLAYGVSINLIEVAWKSQLKIQFPDSNAYNEFMGYFSMSTGVATLFLITIGSNIIRRLGWRIAALTVPIVLLITGGLFFAFVMFKDDFAGVLPWTPLWLAVILGATQNIFCKATKYSLFDPTKEMAYIPLDQESKVKGKAAIDVVGSRMGKSGGGLLQQGIFVLLGPVMANLPLIFALVVVVVFLWIRSVMKLDQLYHAKLKDTAVEEEKERVILDLKTAEQSA